MSERMFFEVAAGEKVSGALYAAGESVRIGATFVLAHGAGAGQSSPFMVRLAEGLSARGLDVLTFNFLYIEQGRRAPDRTEKLGACYRAVLDAVRGHGPTRRNDLFIGGKSLGGRIASYVAANDHERIIAGLAFLGYPLHPPGKPGQLRTAHFPDIRVPMLFIQGTRDPFGTPAELRQALDGQPSATLHFVEGGDHSLARRRQRGVSTGQTDDEIQQVLVAWIRSHR